MDYSIWGPLQQLVYRQKIDKVDHLKQVLNSCWDMISEELIDGPIERRSKRLSFIIRSHGGHITHWAPILLILESWLGANFVYIMNLP